MSPTTILITGANTGLGLETVRALCRSSKPYRILLGSRSIEKARAAISEVKSEQPSTSSTIEPIQIDVEDDASISSAFETVEKNIGHLDILVNNAGASFDQDFHAGKISLRDAWNKAWAVNTTGAHMVTTAFAPLLLKSSEPRLLFIASGTSTLTEQFNQQRPIDRAPPKGWPKQGLSLSAYRSSKTGMNMMMREWARIFREDGVKVWSVSPGLLATGLGGDQEALKKMGAIDPKIGGEFVRAVVEGERDADAGKVIDRNGVQPW